MKKLLFLGLVLNVTFPTTIKAQWYGQIGYQHDSVIHSSACVSPMVNSFVTASYRPVRQVGSTTLDFAIDAVDQTWGTNPAWEYQIVGNCVKPNGTHNCLGISVVENSNPTNAVKKEYAIAGETIDGIFFVTIDATTGNTLKTCSWKKQTQNAQEYKPVIKESEKNPGFFYILANDGPVFHVMQVDGSTGNQVWGATYQPNNGIIEARDIIESKFSTGGVQVAVVGTHYDANSGRGIDGFWTGINPNGAIGTINFPTVYDYNSLDNWFTCVTKAQALTASGLQSYILGGNITDPGLNGVSQLVYRVGATGAAIWGSLIYPSATPTNREICRIYERQNPNAGAPSPNEYYCVANANYSYDVNTNTPYSDDNLVVYKLDDNGDVASFKAAGALTEFHYSGLIASGPYSTYADVTCLETGGGPNDGIQVSGTNVIPPDQSALVRSYFNGVNGCNQTRTDINSIQHLTLNSQSIGISSSSFPQCSINNPTQFDIVLIGNGGSNLCSQVPPVTGGSNARQGNATGLIENKQGLNIVDLFPNPVSGKATVTIPASTEEHAEIEIYSAIGQLVKTINFNARESQKQMIDFSELHVKAGVYFIKLKAGNTQASFKVLYAPE